MTNNEELEKIFNTKLDDGKNNKQQLDPELLEAISLIRSIYWPKANAKGYLAYFVTNAEIELIAERALNKYGIDTIRAFFDFVDHNELNGKREKFTINSMDADLDAFLGKPAKEKPKPSDPKISDFEQSCRYLHLIYAPNQLNVDVLKQPPIAKLVTLTESMVKKYGHKAIEILIDYCIYHKLIPKKGAWTHLTVEADIKTAIKWSVEKPNEYNK